MILEPFQLIFCYSTSSSLPGKFKERTSNAAASFQLYYHDVIDANLIVSRNMFIVTVAATKVVWFLEKVVFPFSSWLIFRQVRQRLLTINDAYNHILTPYDIYSVQKTSISFNGKYHHYYLLTTILVEEVEIWATIFHAIGKTVIVVLQKASDLTNQNYSISQPIDGFLNGKIRVANIYTIRLLMMTLRYYVLKLSY